MKKLWKRLLTGCTALAMALALTAPALAAEGETAPQQPDPWAYEYFADGYALGLVDDNYGSYIKSVVTQEQLDAMTSIVAAKLLETEGENTFFLAEGAGHMVDPGGIVNGLREMGYTVEQVK